LLLKDIAPRNIGVARGCFEIFASRNSSAPRSSDESLILGAPIDDDFVPEVHVTAPACIRERRCDLSNLIWLRLHPERLQIHDVFDAVAAASPIDDKIELGDKTDTPGIKPRRRRAGYLTGG